MHDCVVVGLSVRRALVLSLLGVAGVLDGACRAPRLKPGTGGLRVRVSGMPSDGTAEVCVAPRYESARSFVARHETVRGSSEALFVDLPPDGYRVAVNDAQARGGYYGTWTGQDAVIVRPGDVELVSVSVDRGNGVRGHVRDSVSHAPLPNVYVAPPTRTASSAWPVALPWFWSASDATGAFVLGGLPHGGTSDGQPLRIWFQCTGYLSRSVPLTAGDGNWNVLLERVSAATLAIDTHLTVTRVDADGPAARIGLQPGDRVVATGRSGPDAVPALVPTSDSTWPDTIHRLLDERPGRIGLRVVRGGQPVDLRITLDDPPLE